MRRREVKWLEMLTQWDAYMLRNYRKVTMKTMMMIMHEQKLNVDENVITRLECKVSRSVNDQADHLGW